MSIVSYAGVTLPYAYTDLRQEAVYDDMGGTDWYCTKFDLHSHCVINVNYLSLLAPDLVVAGQPATDNAAAIMGVIRSRLLEPRQTLSLQMNGVELIPQAQNVNGIPLAGTVDAQNGPKPQTCTITQLTNITFLMTFHIIAHYWENNTVTPSGSPIIANQAGNNTLFNRWSESIEIDSANYVRRVREGKFMIRSDNASGRIAGEILTQMAVVGVPLGFLRENSRYVVTPDGLAIQYRVSDKEVFKMPPRPAFEADGEYIESTTSNGALRFGQVRIVLKGAKDTPQAELVRTAIGVGASKVLLNGATLEKRGGFNLLKSASLKVKLYENEVEFIMRCQIKTNKSRIQSIAAFTNLIKTPGSEPNSNYQPSYPIRGSASRLLQAAAYYDPSLRGTQINPLFSQLSAGVEVGRAGVQKET